MSEPFKKPNPNTIEVSLFGGGNAFGESLLIHLGNDYWVIVDSCTNPRTKKPLAYEYLKAIDTNPNDKIKLIVATHWHDDHIKGISEILQNSVACEKVVISSALKSEEFLTLTKLSNDLRYSRNGLQEFKKIFEIATQRNLRISITKQDTLIKREPSDEIKFEIIALSPSDTSVIETIGHFATEYVKVAENPNFVFSKNGQNHNSVVLLIKINDDAIILGADLEVLKDINKGWKSVLLSESIKNTSSIIFKVPHHGSSTAYCKRLWHDFLSQNVYAILTPWKLGHRFLPNVANKETILSHTSSAFITSDIPKVSIVKRDLQVTKIVNQLDINLTKIPFEYGHVRMRKEIGISGWDIELFGSAINLTDLTI